ncbi:DUF4266 domain-containing protein [Plebeiibacterium sediminum]|uniref:DUF4266 domain-containing protein n=1 Tax=Plebeiibacterium sediminum TaxID=2992112 RepID=A0AAE3M233_9BACT|nr:DUF4266 domain-containing protein [Plebeiobacterium sediminum]MCW3785708.1 DUF4266 domain-containing protein [Plebeiobacterium sediminum]
MKKIVLVALLVMGAMSSCVVLKEYEKVNINDPDMALSDKKFKKFETNYQVYREGASGANGGKSGGGCGCN